MATFYNPRKLLSEHGLVPSKKRGQNFLVNQNTADKIIRMANFSSDDHVIEVGVGLGALTNILAKSVAQVTGIEIDSGIIKYHHEHSCLPDNVTLIHGDILKTDLHRLRSFGKNKLKIIANLPYSISNPFIFKLIDNFQEIESVTVMLQQEVAQRLAASPGSKEYGVPSVLLGSCASVKKLMTLKPAEFYPKPKIDSEIVRITFNEFNYSVKFDVFREIVRSSFGSRRKTLLNNLAGSHLVKYFKEDISQKELKVAMTDVIKSAGIQPQCRAEMLSIDDFVNLALSVANYQGDR